MLKRILTKIYRYGSEHLFFVGATLFSAIAHFLFSIYVKTKIDPLEYGIYSSCLLLNTYMAYVQLGSFNSFNRDYPQLLGAKDYHKAKEYRDTTFSFLCLILISSAIIIGFFIGLISRVNNMDPRYTIGLILCIIITVVSVLEQFGNSRVRIDGGFKYTSFVVCMEATSVIIGAILISKIGYYALYITTIIQYLIGIFLFYKRGFKDLSFRINWGLLRNLIVTGLPLLINGLIWTVVNSIDKLVILSNINTEALGIYSIAQMAFSYMVLVPNAMSQLFYVNMGKAYGATHSVKVLNEKSILYTKIIAVVISLISLCAYYFIEPLVIWIMPSYSSGVKSAQILIVGLALYAPTTVNSNILTILKKNSALLRSSIYLCLFNLLCSFGFVLIIGPYIECVALGTAVSYILRTIILIYQLRKYAGSNAMQMLKASVVPAAISIVPGVIISSIIDNTFLSFFISLFVVALLLCMVFKSELSHIIRIGNRN